VCFFNTFSLEKYGKIAQAPLLAWDLMAPPMHIEWWTSIFLVA